MRTLSAIRACWTAGRAGERGRRRHRPHRRQRWENPAIAAAGKNLSTAAAASSAWASPAATSIRAASSSWPACWAWKRDGLYPGVRDKYNWEEHPQHFILDRLHKEVDFGEGKKHLRPGGRQVLVQRDKEVQMAVNEFGDGPCGVYQRPALQL